MLAVRSPKLTNTYTHPSTSYLPPTVLSQTCTTWQPLSIA